MKRHLFNPRGALASLLILTSAIMAPPLFAEDFDEEHDQAHLAAKFRAEFERFFREEPEGQVLRQFIRDQMPNGTMEAIMQHLETKPWEAKEAVEHLGEIAQEYFELLGDNQPYAERFLAYSRLDVQSHLIAAKMRMTRDTAARQELAEELRTILTAAFDRKLEMQRLELAELKAEVEELSQMLKQRADARNEVIERRFRDLTGADEHLDW